MKKRPYRKPTITNLSMPTLKADWVPKGDFTPKGACFTGVAVGGGGGGYCATGGHPFEDGSCFSGGGDSGGNTCFSGFGDV